MYNQYDKILSTDVPIIGRDMSWKDIIVSYPHMTDEVSAFYKKTHLIYGFIDDKFEIDVTEIFGFDVNLCRNGETVADKVERIRFVNKITAGLLTQKEDEFDIIDSYSYMVEVNLSVQEVTPVKYDKKAEHISLRRRKMVLPTVPNKNMKRKHAKRSKQEQEQEQEQENKTNNDNNSSKTKGKWFSWF